jgi:Cu-Zn family superoxide dismutase
LAILGAAALVGCGSTNQSGFRMAGSGPNLQANFVSIGGSALTGAAILRAYDGGVDLAVNINNAPPGVYRIVVHEYGNCSSTNGFSAGPPWAPPGVTVVSATMTKTDYATSLSVRLPGYRFDGPDGVMGRSVVVHAGALGPLDAQPGVPNNRIACGIIGVPRSLLSPAT